MKYPMRPRTPEDSMEGQEETAAESPIRDNLPRPKHQLPSSSPRRRSPHTSRNDEISPSAQNPSASHSFSLSSFLHKLKGDDTSISEQQKEHFDRPATPKADAFQDFMDLSPQKKPASQAFSHAHFQIPTLDDRPTLFESQKAVRPTSPQISDGDVTMDLLEPEDDPNDLNLEPTPPPSPPCEEIQLQNASQSFTTEPLVDFNRSFQDQTVFGKDFQSSKDLSQIPLEAFTSPEERLELDAVQQALRILDNLSKHPETSPLSAQWIPDKMSKMHINSHSTHSTFGFERELATDDILVESTPQGVSGWDFISAVPIRDRYSIDFMNSFPRSKLLFLLSPVNGYAGTLNLSLETIKKQKDVVANSIELDTLLNYASIIYGLVKFAIKEQVPVEYILPTNSDLVYAYASHRAGDVRAGTIAKLSPAVLFWNSLYGFNFQLPPTLWKSIRKGAANLQPDAKPERGPIDIYDLRAIVQHHDPTNPCDVAVVAAAITLFTGMARTGELTLRKVENWREHAKKITTREDLLLKPDDKGSLVIRSAILNLKWDKTNKSHGRSLYIFSQALPDDLNPFIFLLRHRDINDPPKDYPIFSYKSTKPSDTEPWRPLSSGWFNKRIKDLLTKAGRPPLSGHSFRIGGATHFLLTNIPPEVVKKLGGWKSDAFLIYWRKIMDIAEMHFETRFNEGDEDDDCTSDVVL